MGTLTNRFIPIIEIKGLALCINASQIVSPLNILIFKSNI